MARSALTALERLFTMAGELRDAHVGSPILSFAHTRAARLYQEGIWHEEKGEEDDALRLFEHAVEVDPDYAPARIALAYHYRRTERIPAAVEQAEQAVAAHPTPDTWYTLGHMLALNQRYDRALRALRRCLELDPSYDQAYHQIAFVYYLRGEYDVAITEFHRARQHEPDWQTLFFLGECYRLTRRLHEAQHVFHKALTLADGWPQARITRGQLDACTRLTEFPPGHTLSAKDQAYCDSGIVYLGSGQDDGIEISSYPFYQFDYADLGVTLHRLATLCRHHGWGWRDYVPVDELSRPLALALGELLPRKEAPGATLHVQALGRSMAPLQGLELAPLEQSFCLLACWQGEWLPDICGLATPLRGSLPWYHANTLGHLQSMLQQTEQPEPLHSAIWRDARSPYAVAADILAACRRVAPEANHAEQLRYYEIHHRLRWRHDR